MSSANRGAVRRRDDFYRTPEWAVAALLNRIRLRGRLLDPGCGDGSITSVLLDNPMIAEVAGIELDCERARECKRKFPQARVFCGDFLRSRMIEEAGPFDGVVANPPFSLAEEFLRRSRQLVKDCCPIYFLLRLGFLESKKRRYLYEKGSGFSSIRFLPKRPSFTDIGTDSASYGWFCWVNTHRHMRAFVERLYIEGYDS